MDVYTVVRTPANFKKVKKVHRLSFDERFIDPETPYYILQINDLALLELEEPFRFGEQTGIYPACLLDFEINRFDGEFALAGFGLTKMQNWTETKPRPELEHLPEQSKMNSDYPVITAPIPELFMTKLRLVNSTDHLILASDNYSSGCYGN